ncbi:MAG: ATP synthase F1 subunit delta, partial [Phycisphaerae bacterium]|nr:ATP synthase F1 subunit delta [Phycisphaerae bacterium]
MQPRMAALANIYARGLLETLPKNDHADEIADEIDAVVVLLDKIDGFETLLTRAMLSGEEREQLVERIFSGRVSEPVEAFITVLARRDRLFVLRAAAMKFRNLLNIRKGLMEVHVTTSKPLSEQRNAELSKTISEQLDSDVILIDHVDPNMLGGIVVRVGDRVFSASLAASI